MRCLSLGIACFVCHSLALSRRGLCADCEERLLSRLTPSKGLDPIPHHYLFRWTAQNELLGRYLHAMKLKGEPSVWRRWAKLVSLSGLRWEGATIVPAPPRQLGHRDHAWGLARALSDISGRPLISPLRRGPDLREQKNRSAEERSRIRLSLIKAQPCENYTNVLFVDDVLTTGATALAAQHALRASNFRVFSLAYRPLLRAH